MFWNCENISVTNAKWVFPVSNSKTQANPQSRFSVNTINYSKPFFEDECFIQGYVWLKLLLHGYSQSGARMLLLRHLSKFVYCFEMSACVSKQQQILTSTTGGGNVSLSKEKRWREERWHKLLFYRINLCINHFLIKLSKTYQVLRICRPRNGKIEKHRVSFDYFEKTFLMCLRQLPEAEIRSYT